MCYVLSLICCNKQFILKTINNVLSLYKLYKHFQVIRGQSLYVVLAVSKVKGSFTNRSAVAGTVYVARTTKS